MNVLYISNIDKICEVTLQLIVVGQPPLSGRQLGGLLLRGTGHRVGDAYGVWTGNKQRQLDTSGDGALVDHHQQQVHIII